MKVITVGRDMGNDIVIDDSFVGRHHLEIIQDEAGAFFLQDLNSKNGTFVNGQRITGEVPLDEHDIIKIGDTTLSWISYFMTSNETEGEEGKTKQKRKKKHKKTPEEKRARREKFKKSMGNVGKWIGRTMLAILTSLLMMYIFTKMRGHF
ncbi:MAG: FHA domain-containing protein [Muribaculaceae bacterium]|nr:FHA domain-containing protein [Muribaculaceae bacterium]